MGQTPLQLSTFSALKINTTYTSWRSEHFERDMLTCVWCIAGWPQKPVLLAQDKFRKLKFDKTYLESFEAFDILLCPTLNQVTTIIEKYS